MIIQIDQSGKLEKTNISTVIGFSNGKSRALTVTAEDKLKIKKYFRASGKRKVYIYQCFAVIIFLLLKDEKKLDLVVIDTEYPGQEPLIKSYLMNLLREHEREDLDKSNFVFRPIGKASKAHEIVYKTFKGELKSEAVSAKKILDLV